MSRCGDPQCRCGIRYPVVVTWPDDWEYRSIYELRNLSRTIEGQFVRPALTLCFNPEAIDDVVERARLCHLTREIFHQDPADGITVAGSADPILTVRTWTDRDSTFLTGFRLGCVVASAVWIVATIAAKYLWPI